jgi:hypothetical protein
MAESGVDRNRGTVVVVEGWLNDGGDGEMIIHGQVFSEFSSHLTVTVTYGRGTSTHCRGLAASS